MDIQHKVAIVTGASTGIGRATAELLAQHGAKVALIARSIEKLHSVAHELPNSLVVPTDLSDADAIQSMVSQVIAHYGHVDILINNAGRGMFADVETIDIDKLRDLLEVNVIAPLMIMQEVIPHMRAAGGGVIINISSGVSKLAIPGLSGYASTKYALNALSLTARAELAADNIRVGLVHPGRTMTEFGKNAIGYEKRHQLQSALRRTQNSADASTEATPIVDSPEFVSERILEAIQTECAEQYMHEAQLRELGLIAPGTSG